MDEVLPGDWMIAESLPEQELESEEYWSFCLSVRRKMAEKGWLSLWWPKEYGGQERSMIEFTILREEIFYRAAPGFDNPGVVMLPSALLTYGTEEQKRKHLTSIARGEVQWCQGFSEPNAGSDLASLTMSAIEDEDYFIVDGQKCWTTMGHRADWGFFLVRTDAGAARHKGLSLLLVDMKTPGISMNPVYNLLGHHHWSEVFFDQFRVPRSNLLGEKNHGWSVATTILNNERVVIEACAMCKRALDWMIRYVKETGTLAKNPIVRHKLATLATKVEVSRLLCYRTAWLQDKGLNPVHEASMGKVFANDLLVHVADAGLQVLGLYGHLAEDSKWAPLSGVLERIYLAYPPWTIAGGSPEIQKSIIATIGLRLPKT